jgi:hypothetical protein
MESTRLVVTLYKHHFTAADNKKGIEHISHATFHEKKHRLADCCRVRKTAQMMRWMMVDRSTLSIK